MSSDQELVPKVHSHRLEEAYIRSVTNFLADVTMCRAATAAPCLGGTSAAPFLGAHDPVGHFL